jgi:thioredoxin reductase (NADPH)
VCDGFEATDLKIAVYGKLDDAFAKALFLRTYSRDVTILPIEEERTRLEDVTSAGIAVAQSAPAHFRKTKEGITVKLRNGKWLVFNVLYPALGCEVHSSLAKRLGASCTEVGCVEVDAKQVTSVIGLYAAGDVVSDLHQLSVAEGHGAIAATAIHNSLPRTFR